MIHGIFFSELYWLQVISQEIAALQIPNVVELPSLPREETQTRTKHLYETTF